MSRAYLLLAIAIFLVVQAKLFVAHEEPSVFRDFDGVHYLESAETGKPTDPVHGPGYPNAIRFVSTLGVDLYSSAKLVSRISGLLVLLTSWLVLRQIASPTIAGPAILFTSMCWVFIQTSHMIMSDMLAAAMFWVALAAAILPAPSRPWMRGVVSGSMGLAIGIAYLTRYAYFVSLIIPLFLLVGSKESWRQRGVAASCTLMGFLLITGPKLFEVATTPVQLFGENYGNVAFRVFTDGNNLYEYHDFHVHGLFDILRAAPGRFVWNWGRNFAQVPHLFAQYFQPPHPSKEFFSLSGTLMLVGIPFLCWKWNRQKTLLVLGLLVYMMTVGAAWFDNRILIPALPFVALLLTSGIYTMVRGITFVKATRFLEWPLMVAASAWMLRQQTPSAKQMFEQLLEDRTEYQVAADWLHDVGVNSEIPVACNEPLVAMSAGARPIDLKQFQGRGDELAQLIQGGFLVLVDPSANRDPDLVRYFRFLGGRPPENITKVFQTSNGENRLVIYQVDH